jgi:hypothetical protein
MIKCNVSFTDIIIKVFWNNIISMKLSGGEPLTANSAIHAGRFGVRWSGLLDHTFIYINLIYLRYYLALDRRLTFCLITCLPPGRKSKQKACPRESGEQGEFKLVRQLPDSNINSPKSKPSR